MSARATVSIGSFDFPEPSTYNGTASTLVDNARNAQGYVVGAVIREDVAKVEMKWNYLTATQWSNILKQFSEKHGGAFYNDVTFLDQVSNTWVTREMYVSDRKAGLYMRNTNTGEISYTNASLSLVEV